MSDALIDVMMLEDVIVCAAGNMPSNETLLWLSTARKCVSVDALPEQATDAAKSTAKQLV